MGNVLLALGLTLGAGMATALGSVLAFRVRRTDYRFLSVATGFSGGVMLYVSFVEILPKGLNLLLARYGEPGGHWMNAAAFFGGLLLIGLIDNLIPAAENPHETRTAAERQLLWPVSETAARTADCGPPTRPVDGAGASGPGAVSPGYPAAQAEARVKAAPGTADDGSPPDRAALRPDARLLRMGVLTALAIGIHNFPEGLATFLAALQDPRVGLAIAVAVALHNVPEGVSVSVPIYYATGNRRQAFLLSVLSGLLEPIGALIAYLVLRTALGGQAGALPPEMTGLLFGLVAGIMVYISVDELLPTSRAYGKGHDSLYGLVSGMLVMALSLLLMK